MIIQINLIFIFINLQSNLYINEKFVTDIPINNNNNSKSFY